MAGTLTGRVWDLAQWFQAAEWVPNGFVDPGCLGTVYDNELGMEAREMVAGEAARFTRWAIDREGRVLLQTPNGRVLIELVDVGEGPRGLYLCDKHKRTGEMALLTWLPKGRTTLWRTWFNKSSISDIGDRIRAAGAAKRLDMNALFIDADTDMVYVAS